MRSSSFLAVDFEKIRSGNQWPSRSCSIVQTRKCLHSANYMFGKDVCCNIVCCRGSLAVRELSEGTRRSTQEKASNGRPGLLVTKLPMIC